MHKCFRNPLLCAHISKRPQKGKCWPLGWCLVVLHHIWAHLKQCFPAVSSCFPSRGIFLLVYPPNAVPPSLPPPPPPSPLSSRQTWQASLHSDFQSRPVLCQMLRGNIKRSAGQSLPGIPAWWADNWRQASADLADVWWVFTGAFSFFFFFLFLELCVCVCVLGGCLGGLEGKHKGFLCCRPLLPP